MQTYLVSLYNYKIYRYNNYNYSNYNFFMIIINYIKIVNAFFALKFR